MVAFRSSTTATTTAGNETSRAVNAPAGVALNDVVLLFVVDWSGSTITITSTGFTQVRRDNDAGTGDIGLTVLRKIATASEPTTYTVSMSAADSVHIAALAYSSGDTTTPVDVSGDTVADPASGNSTASTPSVTTTAANDVLVVCHAAASMISGGTPSWSAPTGTTQRVASFAQLGGGTPNGAICMRVDDVSQAASGASATYASTITTTSTAAYGTAACVIALKDAGGAVADPFPAGYGRWPQRRPPNMRTLLAR